MHKLHEMLEKIEETMAEQLNKGIDNVDTKEFGDVADIYKDLMCAKKDYLEACYYKTVIEAMNEYDPEDEKSEDYEDFDMRRYYRGQPRSKTSGRFMRRGDGRRSYTPYYHMTPEMYREHEPEYYRDMGYHVAIMADSTSRWAEALREISGRLEEMPAEEGFPAYLPSRLSEFYERAGYMVNLNDTEGSVTIIGAVSPQGSDFSEPVTQNTKRFVRCFWALDKSLAYARHYPAINWMTSYSEYLDDLSNYYNTQVGRDFLKCRQQISNLLSQEAQLMEIVKLIGSDVLPDHQKLIIEIANVIRVGFLQQNAFHQDDTFVSMEKQLKMMQVILYLYEQAQRYIAKQIPISLINETGLFDKLIKIKYDVPNDKLDLFDSYYKAIDDALSNLAEA